MQQINRIDDQTMIWKINSLNSRFQILNATSGNQLQTIKDYNQGYVADIITGNVQNMHYEWNLGSGNLILRNDIKHSLQESFNYDNLDRLTQIVPSNNSTMSIAYQQNGNIDYSTTAGSYYYTGSQPHAATLVTDPANIISDNPQEIEYTSYNKVKRIVEDINELKISYGVKHERNKEEFYENSTLNKTRYFSHGNYETEITSTNERKLNYISSPDGVIAVYEMNNEVGAMYYIHKDHLGSWQVITDQAGHAIQEQSFDAWGRRRNPDNWTYNNINPVQKFHRGYTGHEQLDQFALINMNGRMYDPATARFLSPDKCVQNPGFSQSYNKYSYCVNNPLKYTDPSGWYKHMGSANSDDPLAYYSYMSGYWSQFTSFSSFYGHSGGGGGTSLCSSAYSYADGTYTPEYLSYIQQQLPFVLNINKTFKTPVYEVTVSNFRGDDDQAMNVLTSYGGDATTSTLTTWLVDYTEITFLYQSNYQSAFSNTPINGDSYMTLLEVADITDQVITGSEAAGYINGVIKGTTLVLPQILTNISYYVSPLALDYTWEEVNRNPNLLLFRGY